MRVTNNLNLPAAFVKLAQSDYKYKDKRYSATTLLKPTRQIILLRRYHDQLEQDVADMVWMIWGSAVHKVIEAHDETGFAEIKLEHTLDNGRTISGEIDLYCEKLAEVVDYKTASVHKVLKKDFEDWRRQGWIYGWLIVKKGLPCSSAKFHALLKDWSERAKKQARWRKEDYPEHSIFTPPTFKFGESEFATTEKWLYKKTDEIAANELLPDEELIECSSEERWADSPKFAVYKNKGDKKAKKLFDDRAEAEQFMRDNKCEHVQDRPGEDKRCQYYCMVNKFCPYWLKKYGNKEEQQDEE